jgi:hypothetical protein
MTTTGRDDHDHPEDGEMATKRKHLTELEAADDPRFPLPSRDTRRLLDHSGRPAGSAYFWTQEKLGMLLEAECRILEAEAELHGIALWRERFEKDDDGEARVLFEVAMTLTRGDRKHGDALKRAWADRTALLRDLDQEIQMAEYVINEGGRDWRLPLLREVWEPRA